MGSGGGHEARGRSAMDGDVDAATGAGGGWRSSDRRVTFLLMAVEVPIAGLGYLIVLMSGMTFGGCAEQIDPCDYALGDFAFLFARWGIGITSGLSIVAALISMVAGRWSRWIPALGTAVVMIVTVISLVLTRIAVG
jgi:hypothetical protein